MQSTQAWRSALAPVAEVCDVEVVTAPGGDPDARPGLLIEVPHGAARRRHFAATLGRLKGKFPTDLEEFFYVNTDVGSIECARCIASMLVNPAGYPELSAVAAPFANEGRRLGSVVIVRGLVARTFVDLNRVINTDGSEPRVGASPSTVTPGLPAYVTRPDDIEMLLRMHGDYQAVAARAYEVVCGSEAPVDSAHPAALILHTYAPRTVALDRVDEHVVTALRRAYEPGVFATLERRPDVDLITETVAGEQLAPEALVRAVRLGYAAIGIGVGENATYRLDASTMGYVRSASYPGRVLCVELNRALLADPFIPFAEMSISALGARRMAAPIAAAFLRHGRAH